MLNADFPSSAGAGAGPSRRARRRPLASLLFSLPLLLGLAAEVAAAPDDVIQLRNEKRKIAEFGNHKANGGVRVIVDIGDGMSLASSARTINYEVGGTADLGSDKDYTIDGCTSKDCTVRLPANTHSVPITIYVNDDGLDENDETIVLTLKGGTDYTLNNKQKETTITIVDNDTRGLVFHRRWADVDEGSSGTKELWLSSQPTGTVTVTIASDNPDVTVSPSSLTFNPSGSNRWNRKRTVTISAAQDDDANHDTATVTYTTSGADYGGANALNITRPVSVHDDDTDNERSQPTTPSASFASGSSSAAENAGTRNVRVNLSAGGAFGRPHARLQRQRHGNGGQRQRLHHPELRHAVGCGRNHHSHHPGRNQ